MTNIERTKMSKTFKQEIADILLDLMHDIAKETREGTVSESEAILGIVQRREKDTDQIIKAFKLYLPFSGGQPLIDPDMSPFDAYELARNNFKEDMERILE